MQTRSWTRAGVLLISGALALTAAACARSERDSGGGNAAVKDTLVFGASGDPASLDPLFTSDGESFRVSRQIVETLVDFKPGTTEVEGRLATAWSASPDAKDWTFTLRPNVKFTDGTAFNAAAVCANFERWYNLKGKLLQSSGVTYYYITVFRGFKTNDNTDLAPSLYRSCEAKSDSEVTIHLTDSFAALPSTLTLSSFAIQSPSAMQQFQSDRVGGTEAAPSFDSEYGTAHVTGTGPYRLVRWNRGQDVTLVRNDDYWGAKAITKNLIIRTISDNNARRQALENGSIQMYDQVSPGDVDALRGAGYNVVARPPFSLGYIGLNQAKKPLDNPKVRQAIAFAINRQNVVSSQYPPSAVVPPVFTPKVLAGYTEDVPKYEYNPDRARQLLSEAGVTNPTIEFAYPTEVSRAYMPSPVDNWTLIKKDLESVGFTVKEKHEVWGQYIPHYNQGDYQVYLAGWNADFADSENFLGVFFDTRKPQFGWNDAQTFGLVTQARKEPDQANRDQLYRQANQRIMEQLPMVPYVMVGSLTATGKGLTGYVANPLGGEDYGKVTLT